MLHQIWCKIDVQTTLYKWEFSSIRFKHAHSKLHVQATIEDNIRCSILLIDIRLYKNTRSTAIDWHYVSRSYEQGQQQLIDSYDVHTRHSYKKSLISMYWLTGSRHCTRRVPNYNCRMGCFHTKPDVNTWRCHASQATGHHRHTCGFHTFCDATPRYFSEITLGRTSARVWHTMTHRFRDTALVDSPRSKLLIFVLGLLLGTVLMRHWDDDADPQQP